MFPVSPSAFVVQPFCDGTEIVYSRHKENCETIMWQHVGAARYLNFTRVVSL